MTLLQTTIYLFTILYTSQRVICAVDDNLKCTDWNNQYIDDGQEFNPKKEDPCYVCICNKGYTERCKSVRCTAPTEPCDRYVPVEGACCQFKCLDKKTNGGGGGGRNATTEIDRDSEAGSSDSITTLGLRLVASTVTSFLVLALLLFMVHRIRQRRLMLAMRRYHNSRRRDQLDDFDHDGFTQDYLGIQSPPPYEDPPPPYSPPKPPQRVLPSESPPPYDSVDNNANINNNNNNNDVQCQTEHSEMLYNNQNLTSINRDDVTNQSGDCAGVSVQLSHHNGEARSVSPCSANINDGISELSSISFSDNHVYYNPRSSSSSASSNRFNSNTLNNGMTPFPLNAVYPEYTRNVNTIRLQNPSSSSFCNQHDIPVLDRSHDLDKTDDSSSYASDSFSPYPRRPCRENNFHTLQGCIPPYPHDGTDSDDLSTEMSLNIFPIHPMKNHAEDVVFPNLCSFTDGETHKPAKISYIDRQNNSVYQNNTTSNNTLGNDVNCRHGNAALTSGFVGTFPRLADISSEVSEGHLDIQDVSVSDICTSSVDNTPAKACTDAKQLRELRLSNLLRSPSGESSEGPLSPVNVQVSSQNIPRSQSDVSMFSVCSETGEKKLSQIVGIALQNDAPYPDNICKGRQSLAMSMPTNQEELNKIQLNQNEDIQHPSINTKSNLDNSDCQKDRDDMMKGNVQVCDEGGNVLICNGSILDRQKKHDGKNKNTHSLSDQSKFDKKSCVSECSNSSSEKNCNSDTKFLIKSQQKCSDRRGKKDTMGNSVMTHRKRNKHRVHRLSTGSLPHIKQRSLYTDSSQNSLLPPFDQNMQVPTHQDNQTELGRDNHSGNIQQTNKDVHNVNSTSSIHHPKSKKKSKITKTLTTTELSNKNSSLNSPKNLCNNREDKNQYDSLQINSNFSAMETPLKEKLPSDKHLINRQLSHKSSKSYNDASLLCPAGKGFSHRKSRNSKWSKNRKSHPEAVLTQNKMKDKNLLSPPVVSYVGVKKETEFSSDGVKEKLTFHDGNDLVKHVDLNEDLYRIEKCSYV